METENVGLIVCGVLIFVALLNTGLIFGVLRGKNRNRFEVIGKAIRAAQNPWRDRDEQIEELRQRVSDLEQGENEVTQNGS
jgi:hypothetical protein